MRHSLEITDDDFPVSCKLVLASAIATSIGIQHPDILERIQRLAAFERRGRCRRTAILEGQVIGFVDWQNRGISWLMVHKDFQGQGVGSYLLRTVETDQHEPISVLCVASNSNAIRFYNRHGYKTVSHNIPGKMFGLSFNNVLLEKIF